MKTHAIILAAFVFLSGGAFSQVPFAGPPKVKIDKISPAVVTTPEYSVKNTTDKRSDYLKWFEIEVEFSVDGPEIVDELVVTFLVELNGKLCPGETTLVNVPKGRSRYTVMYMSPRSIDRLTGGKALTAAMVGNMWVDIKKQGQTLATDSLKKGKPPNAQTFPGLLVQKAETPFQVLWWDRYEAVKLTR